ncbi:MAG: tyrosine-type recombinase/integrase [Anaerolineales bacterium]|nr:tyrosine-type recombinase/integrase [Anaerolineales bacterium]
MKASQIEKFGDHLRNTPVAPRSVRACLGDLRAFAAWFEAATGENFDPVTILRGDVLDWRAAMAKTHAPATVNRRLSSLRRFYAWATRQGLISLDPTNGVRGPSQIHPTPNPPAAATLEKILHAARTTGTRRDRALLELLADAGLRPAELAGLRLDDLELEAASAWLTVAGDRGRPTRRIPLSIRSRVALREYLEEREPAGKAGPLFASRNKGAISPFIVWHVVHKYAAQAGVGEVRPRDFRNAAASRLVGEHDLVSAAAFLGEKDLNSLARFVPSGQ